MKDGQTRRRRLALASMTATIALGLAWTGLDQAGGKTPEGFTAGYLGEDRIPDDKIFLPPPPTEDSAIGQADRAIFLATRAERGGERWKLAARDNAADPAGLLETFECALGTRLRPGDAPALERLLERARTDALVAIRPPKDRYQRARPFLRAEDDICIAVTPELSASGSYPSGHSTVGWLYGLILGEMAPGRASDILARGRIYGESRAICGVHFQSDVEAGRTLAAALVSALHSDEGFKADLAAAKAELDRLRSHPAQPDPAQCAIERTAIAATPAL